MHVFVRVFNFGSTELNAGVFGVSHRSHHALTPLPTHTPTHPPAHTKYKTRKHYFYHLFFFFVSGWKMNIFIFKLYTLSEVISGWKKTREEQQRVYVRVGCSSKFCHARLARSLARSHPRVFPPLILSTVLGPINVGESSVNNILHFQGGK